MATRQSNIIITANGKQAEAVLKALDSRIKELKNDEAGLKAQMDALRRAGKSNSDEYKNLQKQLQATRREMKSLNDATTKNVSNMEKVNKAVKDLANTSTRQLRDALRAGKKELERLSGSSKDLEPLKQKLQQIQQQIAKNTSETSKFGKTHGSVWQTAVRTITAYVGVFGAFNFIKTKITEIIKLNNQLSDQMADIRKVSGLAMEDIRQLTMNLSKIDTRTTLEELNKIAYAGAKLGFGNQGIEGLESFTRAANQVNVALKEDLGEEALTALSKITENMGLIKKMGVEQAMLATGSAMFKLASTSTAAAGPIVEVTKRIVPMAKSMGLATYEILALASSADSLQLPLEVTGTALSKFFAAIQTNHNLIENSLSITPGTLESWIKQGKAMDAILLIFDKMKEKGNMSQLQPIVKLLGGDGARLITVLQSMSQEVDRVRSHLKVSKDAFMEATAVTEEYNIQQETAAALVERANNMWRNAFVNPEASESVKDLARSWYDFTKSLLATPEAMMSVKVGLDAIIGALKLLIQLIPGIIGFGIVKLLGGLTSALGLGKIATQGFTAAWKSMSTAMKANWIGLAVAALVELYHQIKITSAATEEAEERTISATKAAQNAIEKAEQEIQTLSQLKAQIDNVNISHEERNRLLSKIKTDYDIYLSYLGVEINTVDDLARHYDALTKVMRQRFAYQEKEEYKKTVMGGEGGSRMNRRMAGATLIKELKKAGLNSDNEVINYLYDRVVKSTKEGTSVDMDKLRYSLGLNTDVDYKSERAAKSALNYFVAATIKEAQEDIGIEAAFAPEIGDFDIDKFLREQVKGDFRYQPDKSAIAAAKAAAAQARRDEAKARRERLAALRAELKDAEQESDAIIAKIEEWYRLQETFVEDAVADGKLTRDYADAYLRSLKISKNQTLANARKSIAGKMNKEDWLKYVKPELERMMADQGAWSKELAGDILAANLEAIHNLLARFNGSADVMGLKSTASFDKIMKNAAGNEREIARERAKIKEEVDKILLEYKYVEQAERAFHSNLVGLGIMTETYEQYVERMKTEAEKAGQKQEGEEFDKDAIGLKTVSVTAKRPQTQEDKLLQAFLSHGAKPYSVDTNDEWSLYVWLQNLMSNYDFDEELNLRGSTEEWVKGFPQLEEWVNDIGKYKPEVQKFYFALINWENEYYEAKKKAYERDRKLQEERFRASGESELYEQQQKALETQGKFRKITGMGADFGQQYGLEDAIAEDPEIARIKLRMEWRAKELEDAKAHGAAQELINQRQTELLEEFSNLANAVSTEIANRISKIKELAAPAATFAEEMGMKMGDAIFNMESQSKNWNQIIKDMILNYSTMTIKMIAENMTKKIQMALFYKQMEAGEIAHQTTMLGIQQAYGAMRVAGEATTDAEVLATKSAADAAEVTEEVSMATILTSLGISKGAAKIIGSLGWWGIPLIAVISSLLIGLLTSALSTAGKKSSTSAATPKTKLVSGMLTYDEGNVQSYVGTDGHVYKAKQQSPPSGAALVKSPIATTINGSPSLVAERGPEIVIGRRTTRHIMMNEPGLLQHLANLDRRRATRYRPYDDGNITDLFSVGSGSAAAPSPEQAERDEQMRQTLDTLAQTVAMLTARLNHPIEAKINKYGTGGLIDEVQSGLKFMNKYQ